MKDISQFIREQDARRGLSEKSVISMISDGVFDGSSDEAFIEGIKKYELLSLEYSYLLVFPLSDKSLHDLIVHDGLCDDKERVRRLFSEICHCLQILHTADRIHGDIKPLNILRNRDGSMILTDLDASVPIGASCGVKLSTSYLPPEMFDRREIRRPGGKAILSAHISYDMWALGVVLYELLTGLKLWKSDVHDNIDNPDDIDCLCQWTLSLKSDKLSRIKDPYARNLVSQLLSKDFDQRPDVLRTLSHPFITQKEPRRMPGDTPKNDVFLSYRVSADAPLVNMIHGKLINRGLTVFWDHVSLPDGEEWQLKFADGLLDSLA